MSQARRTRHFARSAKLGEEKTDKAALYFFSSSRLALLAKSRVHLAWPINSCQAGQRIQPPQCHRPRSSPLVVSFGSRSGRSLRRRLHRQRSFIGRARRDGFTRRHLRSLPQSLFFPFFLFFHSFFLSSLFFSTIRRYQARTDGCIRRLINCNLVTG